MAWWTRWGDKAEWLSRCAHDAGEEPPQEVADMPSLLIGAREPWEAFQVLTKRRPLWSLGMGGAVPGHIPVAEINAYLDHLRITDDEERDFLFQCIDALDDEYVRHVNDEMAKKAKTDSKQGSG